MESEATAWRRLRRWLIPRISLSLYGDRAGLCGADASVMWLGREWLRCNLEERPQRGVERHFGAAMDEE